MLQTGRVARMSPFTCMHFCSVITQAGAYDADSGSFLCCSEADCDCKSSTHWYWKLRPFCPHITTPLFLFTCESLAIIFYSADVETKEIIVKLQQIMKHTFRYTTYSEAIRFRFTVQYQWCRWHQKWWGLTRVQWGWRLNISLGTFASLSAA